LKIFELEKNQRYDCNDERTLARAAIGTCKVA